MWNGGRVDEGFFMGGSTHVQALKSQHGGYRQQAGPTGSLGQGRRRQRRQQPLLRGLPVLRRLWRLRCLR